MTKAMGRAAGQGESGNGVKMEAPPATVALPDMEGILGEKVGRYVCRWVGDSYVESTILAEVLLQ